MEIVLVMGLHNPARPNHCTPMPTSLFLVELSVKATNWFLFGIVANSMALDFSGVLTVTGGIHGGLAYASMLSRLESSHEENLKAVFCNWETQVLFAKLIARLAFPKPMAKWFSMPFNSGIKLLSM